MKNLWTGTLAGACAATMMLPFDFINYRTQFYWPAALEALSPEPVDEYSGNISIYTGVM